MLCPSLTQITEQLFVFPQVRDWLNPYVGWVARADALQVIPAVDEEMPQADEKTSGVQRSLV